MSILIKGMKMPKNCMLCNFCAEEADPANGEICMATGTLMAPCTRERLDNCPLVELPTHHGRLIDADSLKESVTKLKFHNTSSEDVVAVFREIILAPTIIEAEEVQDGTL